MIGDLDSDGDVDWDDFDMFVGCFTGRDGQLDPACVRGDLDGDGDVDCEDFKLFQDVWVLPGDPPELAVCSRQIPTVSEWGLVAMMLLVLVSGTLLFRRGGFAPVM
jgi:hypothetical protein